MNVVIKLADEKKLSFKSLMSARSSKLDKYKSRFGFHPGSRRLLVWRRPGNVERLVAIIKMALLWCGVVSELEQELISFCGKAF